MAEKYLFFEDTASTIETTALPLSRLHHIDVADDTVTCVFDSHQDGTENAAATVSVALTCGDADEETVLEQIANLCAYSRGGLIDVVASTKATVAEVTEVA